MADNHIDEPLDYLYEELTPEEMAGVRSHLAECPRCRADMRAIRETVKTYRQAARPRPPAGLARRAADLALKEARGQSPEVDAEAIVSRSFAAALPKAAQETDDVRVRNEATQAMIEQEFDRLKREVVGEMRVGWRTWLFHPGWAIAAGALFVLSILIVYSPRMSGRFHGQRVQYESIPAQRPVHERKSRAPILDQSSENNRAQLSPAYSEAAADETPEVHAESSLSGASLSDLVDMDEPAVSPKEEYAPPVMRQKATVDERREPVVPSVGVAAPSLPVGDALTQSEENAWSVEAVLPPQAVTAAEAVRDTVSSSMPLPQPYDAPGLPVPAQTAIQEEVDASDDAGIVSDGYAAPLFLDALPPPSPAAEAMQKATMGAVQPDIQLKPPPAPASMAPSSDAPLTGGGIDSTRRVAIPPPSSAAAPSGLPRTSARERQESGAAPAVSDKLQSPSVSELSSPISPVAPQAPMEPAPVSGAGSAALRPPAPAAAPDRYDFFLPSAQPEPSGKADEKNMVSAPKSVPPLMSAPASSSASPSGEAMEMWEQVVSDMQKKETGDASASAPGVIVEWQGPMEPPQIVERPTPVNVPERIQTLINLAVMAMNSGDMQGAREAIDLLRRYDKEAAERQERMLADIEKSTAEAARAAEQQAPASSPAPEVETPAPPPAESVIPSELAAPPAEPVSLSQPQVYMETVEPPEDPPMSLVRVPAYMAPPEYAQPITEEPVPQSEPAAVSPPPTQRPQRERRRPRAAASAPAPSSEPIIAEDMPETSDPEDESVDSEDEPSARQGKSIFSRPSSSSLWESTVGREVRPLVRTPRRGSGQEQKGRRPFSTDPYVRGD